MLVGTPAPPLTPPLEQFEYYDAGNHWCKNCNVTSGSMFDFFTHLHSKTHRKTLDPYDRPWASTPTKTVKNTMSEEKLTKPAKGSEFLLPVRGFFCLLCKEFYGDAICAEEHVTTHAHNEKYKKQMYENPLYEQRRNLDRQAGLKSETSGKKRKHEDDEKGNKEKEEKSKHKKEKKEKKEEDDAVQKEEKSKVKKEEEEKLKLSKKEQDFKDEDEKYKYTKKDDKYWYSREEEVRGKYSRKDEDDRYKYSREEEHRYSYRKDEDDRSAKCSKYEPREDEDKYKYGKHSDLSSKYDRERDEGKPKADKAAFNKLDQGKPAGKPEVSKAEPPPKPYDPPKILCGPSPAMRAKLRKQSLEASKPAPAAATASFGKFTWKKKENVLAKEAQKVAAEFMKDDEAAVKQNPVSVEDCFAKSVAVAKEIAEKLGGQPNVPSPWVSNRASRGRIRPNLPAPTAVMRKTALMGKPAPLNTFLSIRPQNTSLLGSTPSRFGLLPDPLTKALNDQNALLEGRPKPHQLAEPLPPGSRAAPVVVRPVSKPVAIESKPVLSEAQSSLSEAKAATFGTTSASSIAKPAPFVDKPEPQVSKPAPVQSRPVLSEAQSSPVAKPATSKTPSSLSTFKSAQPAMIKIVSDVAAPGVPESEQTRTVFVKPPPFMTMCDRAQNSEKLKSNLAAAKAQDLFDIFYSSLGQSGTSSISKPAKDSRTDGRSNNNSQLSTPQAQKTQPEHQPCSQSQPSTTVCTSSQADSNNSPSHQTQPESDIQIASVWSLQSTPTPEVTPSDTTLQSTTPELNPPVQSEAHTGPQNLSPTPDLESQIDPQPESAELEPTPQSQSQPKLSPPIQTEPQSRPQANQDTQPSSPPETQPHAALELKPKPSPKNRGKITQTKRTPPAPRPVRQTRSQTRYQTRQQQQSQSEPEPELASGDSDSAASDPKELVTSDPGSGSRSEEAALGEGGPEVMDVTPDTLGLPSDMTSLDFEYDFNFE